MLKPRTRVAFLCCVALIASPASAQLSDYFQDFEGLDRTDFNALSDDGWLLFAASNNGNDAFPNFGDGPFGAPNDIDNPFVSVISDEASGGEPIEGNQGLVVLSDYNSALHNNGASDPRNLIISVFQEQVISAADIGSDVVFSFLADGNTNGPTGNAIAEAFLLTLDPNNGFAATNNLSFDTTALANDSTVSEQLTLSLSDAALEGQILQFGFRNFSQDGEGSAVDYDNVSFTVTAVPEPGTMAIVGLGLIGLAGLRRRS